MKGIISVFAITAAIFFSGCGQDLNLTVYNNTGIVPGSETYCGAKVEWPNGTENRQFAGTGNAISANNSYSVQIKEGDAVTVTGYGWYYAVADTIGNTKLTNYNKAAAITVYGGYLEAPNWYACLYLDKVLIYKK